MSYICSLYHVVVGLGIMVARPIAAETRMLPSKIDVLYFQLVSASAELDRVFDRRFYTSSRGGRGGWTRDVIDEAVENLHR